MANHWRSSEDAFDLNDESVPIGAFLNSHLSHPPPGSFNGPPPAHNHNHGPNFIPHIDLDRPFSMSTSKNYIDLDSNYSMSPPFNHNVQNSNYSMTPPINHTSDGRSPPSIDSHYTTPHAMQHSQDLPPSGSKGKGQGKAPVKPRGKGKGKAFELDSPSRQGVAHRTGNYTHDEDILLCSAFLNVSRDPIVGTDQSNEAYWERIHAYYHENKTFETDRNRSSLHHHWHGFIQPNVNKFCALKAQIDRLNPSGHTEQSRIQKTKTLFKTETKKDFQFMHCWEALRYEKKWEDYRISKAGVADAEESLKLGVSEGLTPPVSEKERTMGRDRAKKLKSGSPSAEESQCYETIKQIFTSRRERQESKDAEKEERSLVQRQKLDLLKEQTYLQQKHAAQRDRELDLRQEENEMRIINMDLNSLPSEAMRKYYAMKQDRILARLAKDGSI